MIGFTEGCSPQILSLQDLMPMANHQGWLRINALGGRSVANISADLAVSSVYAGNGWNGASVTLSWNPMITTPNKISSYNIYRSTESGREDFSHPLMQGISPELNTYTDRSVMPFTTYFYVVRPLVESQEYFTVESDSEIKVPVPPANMALVHRWSANREMCENLMGRVTDRNNNYRCLYVGPGSYENYYDIGQHSFWDTVPLGCNFTPPNFANATFSCGDGINGCLGVLTSGQSYDPNSVIPGGTTPSGNPQVFLRSPVGQMLDFQRGNELDARFFSFRCTVEDNDIK